jgi:hypothetical protein
MAVQTRAQHGIIARRPDRYINSQYLKPAALPTKQKRKKTPTFSSASKSKLSKNKIDTTPLSSRQSNKVNPLNSRSRPNVLTSSKRKSISTPTPPQHKSTPIIKSSPRRKEVVTVPYAQSQRMRDFLFPTSPPASTSTIMRHKKDSLESSLALNTVNMKDGITVPDNPLSIDVEKRISSNGRKVWVLGPIKTRKVRTSGGRSTTYIYTPRGWRVLKRG